MLYSITAGVCLLDGERELAAVVRWLRRSRKVGGLILGSFSLMPKYPWAR